MSDSYGLKVEIFSRDSLVVSFEFLDGSSDLKYLINNQLFSGYPTIFLDPLLSERDTHILRIMNDPMTELQDAKNCNEAFTSLQKGLWEIHMNIDKFIRGLRRGRRKNTLLSGFLHMDLYEGENEKVERQLEELLVKLKSCLYPIQRIIDISKYAEVMRHDLRIYWG